MLIYLKVTFCDTEGNRISMKFITFRCKETLSVRRVSHVVVLFLSALLLLTFTGCHTNNVANQPETEAPAQTVSPTEDAVPQATTPPTKHPIGPWLAIT